MTVVQLSSAICCSQVALFSSRSPEVNDKLENNLYLRVWFVRVQGV